MPIDRSMNVLIMDDYKTMLRIIRNLLKQIEFRNVEEATGGAGAMAKLRAGNFGLVISDWNMAPMTGLELLQEVRSDSRLKSTPFIMVTAESRRKTWSPPSRRASPTTSSNRSTRRRCATR